MENEGARPEVPREPIDRLVDPLVRFMHVESAGGVVLAVCAALALFLANSGWADAYVGIWKIQVGFQLGDFAIVHSLKHWINDGLMVLFFFVIGLEVKRELVTGDLKDLRSAALPVAAALGGMFVPAGLYLALQWGEAGQRGWGIPMATDIAFVVGCMALLGPRIPRGLRVLLLSLAIADDIGAILVIAVGYTEQLYLGWLVLGLAGIGVISLMARLGVRAFLPYVLIGCLVWFGFHESGIHATIAGVILGLMTPARAYLSSTSFGRMIRRADGAVHGDWEGMPHRAEKLRWFQWATREAIPPLQYLETALHPWTSFLILPLFALANAGVPFQLSDVADPVAVAAAAGLVIGKPLGIVLFSWLAVRLGLGRLPEGVGWLAIAGGGLLCGIGFTMALFIAELAIDGPALNAAKVGIIGASVVAAAGGMSLLVWRLQKPAVSR